MQPSSSKVSLDFTPLYPPRSQACFIFSLAHLPRYFAFSFTVIGYDLVFTIQHALRSHQDPPFGHHALRRYDHQYDIVIDVGPVYIHAGMLGLAQEKWSIIGVSQ